MYRCKCRVVVETQYKLAKNLPKQLFTVLYYCTYNGALDCKFKHTGLVYIYILWKSAQGKPRT
jgi:hypothetical protein